MYFCNNHIYMYEHQGRNAYKCDIALKANACIILTIDNACKQEYIMLVTEINPTKVTVPEK